MTPGGHRHRAEFDKAFHYQASAWLALTGNLALSFLRRSALDSGFADVDEYFPKKTTAARMEALRLAAVAVAVRAASPRPRERPQPPWRRRWPIVVRAASPRPRRRPQASRQWRWTMAQEPPGPWSCGQPQAPPK